MAGPGDDPVSGKIAGGRSPLCQSASRICLDLLCFGCASDSSITRVSFAPLSSNSLRIWEDSLALNLPVGSVLSNSTVVEPATRGKSLRQRSASS